MIYVKKKNSERKRGEKAYPIKEKEPANSKVIQITGNNGGIQRIWRLLYIKYTACGQSPLDFGAKFFTQLSFGNDEATAYACYRSIIYLVQIS